VRRKNGAESLILKGKNQAFYFWILMPLKTVLFRGLNSTVMLNTIVRFYKMQQYGFGQVIGFSLLILHIKRNTKENRCRAPRQRVKAGGI